MKTNEIKAMLTEKRSKPSVEGALSTGSTLLNLACTDNPKYGFLKGGYYFIVGDSASGKTWTTLTCFAEAARNKEFDNYRFIFDDVENGALMDMAKFFGKKAADRIEPPRINKKGVPVFSDTVESFYFNIAEAFDAGRPFIYVLDSQDSLTSDSSSKKFDEQREAAEKGREVAGSYGDGKAKYHSEHIRYVISRLRKTGSILIIVGQTRDNLGFGFEKKTRSGGKSLRFYAHLEIWTSIGDKLKRRVRGAARTVGIRCVAEVRKNRITGKIGKDRSVEIPIYYSLGMDDIGSCVDFLIAEKHWRPIRKKGAPEDASGEPKKKIYDVPDLLFQGSREALIRHIEEEGLEGKVRSLAGKIWAEIEAECEAKRKNRYA